jgi:transcription antitermination factor NusG
MLMAMKPNGNIGQVREALQRGDIVGYVEPRRQNVCIVSGRWFGVCTEGRQETLARGEIAAAGLISYLPMVPRRESHGRGAERTTWRPMFPSYMLVKCDPTPDHWDIVKASRGVHRILGIDGPQHIGDDAIDVIRLYEAEQAEKEKHRIRCDEARKAAQEKGKSGIIWDFAPGEIVKIKHGPFAGFYAQLETAVDDHDRIRALVDLFGRQSSTSFSAFDLEAP